MNHFRLLIGTFLCLAIQVPVLAQNCNDNMAATTPASHFHDNRDGSITDQRTGLRWSQCSLGQTWDNGSCLGEARALPYAIVELIAKDRWRLPTLTELSSLIELRCSQPAINNALFPTVTGGVYWTSTRFVNRDGSFWQVHFLHGEAVPEKADSVAFVRWVRKD